MIQWETMVDMRMLHILSESVYQIELTQWRTGCCSSERWRDGWRRLRMYRRSENRWLNQTLWASTNHWRKKPYKSKWSQSTWARDVVVTGRKMGIFREVGIWPCLAQTRFRSARCVVMNRGDAACPLCRKNRGIPWTDLEYRSDSLLRKRHAMITYTNRMSKPKRDFSGRRWMRRTNLRSRGGRMGYTPGWLTIGRWRKYFIDCVITPMNDWLMTLMARRIRFSFFRYEFW